MRQRFYIFVSSVDQGNGNHIEFKISFSNSRGMKQAVKNQCVGGRGGGMLQVSGMW